MGLQVRVQAAIIKNNKVLLVQQTDSGKQPNKWGPPGGHIKKGESLIDCAGRETFEETGLKIKIVGLVQAGIARYKDRDYCIVLFSAVANPNQKIRTQSNEVQNCAWAGSKDLKENKFPLRKEFLKERLILALKQKPAPLDTFKIIHIEED